VSWDVSALAQSHLGNHQVAIENRKKAVERRRIHRGGILGDFFEASESEIYLRAGQFEVAAEVAERVARTSRPNELMLSLCVAERALGCALVQLGAEPTKVDERFHESLKVANTMGLFMEALWTQLAWGQVCKDRGDLETATNHFKQVQERLTDDVSPYVRGEFLEAIRHAAIMPI
jgi:tetratricopeptide (TPR) repeat protein